MSRLPFIAILTVAFAFAVFPASLSVGNGTLSYQINVSSSGTCPVGSPNGPQQPVTAYSFTNFSYSANGATQSLSGGEAYLSSPGGNYCPPNGLQGPYPLSLNGNGFVIQFYVNGPSSQSATYTASVVTHGNIDSPSPGESLLGWSQFFGWYTDSAAAMKAVTLYIDGNSYGAATPTSRQDACNAVGNVPGCPNVGWNLVVDTTQFADGTHTLAVTAVTATGQTSTSTTTFTLVN